MLCDKDMSKELTSNYNLNSLHPYTQHPNSTNSNVGGKKNKAPGSVTILPK